MNSIDQWRPDWKPEVKVKYTGNHIVHSVTYGAEMAWHCYKCNTWKGNYTAPAIMRDDIIRHKCERS